jgi:RNA 3'-terminal phosphate cyclase (ATP)
MSEEKSLLEIDGALGEGGGQVLRTSLSLSLCTGRPIRVKNIRAGRSRPGLLRQHLTALRAATAVGRAEVEGDCIGSREITFRPSGVHAGEHCFSVGTAGSTTLVLQTVLLPLLTASGPSQISLEGGTHNPAAPPFDFLERVYLPLVERMGPRVKATLSRPGFFPAGGGRFSVSVTPSSSLLPLWLESRGAIRRIEATARVAAMRPNIGNRELNEIRKILELDRGDLRCEQLDERFGPGNVVCVDIEAEESQELFSDFGRRGVSAEQVGRAVAGRAKRWLDAEVPVAEHLADQLIPLMAIAGRGGFRTLPLSGHARTQLELVRQLLELPVEVVEEGPSRLRVLIG